MKSAAIFGFGIQGRKRAEILRKKKIPFITVDPIIKDADYKYISDIKKDFLENITHSFVCTPYKERMKILKKIIKFKTKILIEKPGIFNQKEKNFFIKNSINLKKKFYVGYNHRFENCILDLKKKISKIGKIYLVNMTYGNGTAKNIKISKWKDKNKFGVAMDLLPQLYDVYYFLFKSLPNKNDIKINSRKFENKTIDFVKITSNKKIISKFCASYLYWENFFEIFIIGSRGFLKLNGLPKWKKCFLTHGFRILPSGRPKMFQKSYKNVDLTWEKEIKIFLNNDFFFDLRKEIKVYELIKKC